MDIDFLQGTALFGGMTAEEVRLALTALQAAERSFEKNALILRAGGRSERMGLVLAGSVRIESNDLWGNRTLLSRVEAGQAFAETYALLPGEPLLVDVAANEPCRVLFCRAQPLDGPGVPWQDKLMGNILRISLRRNLLLSERSFHTAPKTVRGRVMAYLNSVALRRGVREFDIPFDRQQLADYLNLDRSALSKELGRMRDEGILSCRKNHFVLHKAADNSL